MREWHWEKCRALVSDQAVAIDEEFVAFGLAAEDRMVVENETGFSCASLALKNQRGGETADSSAYDYAVVDLASVDDICGETFKLAIANLVSGLQYGESCCRWSARSRRCRHIQ